MRSSFRLLGALASWASFLPAAAASAPLPLPDGGLLCHPRPEEGERLPVLAERDSLMLNGHLGRARVIRANGRLLRTTADGRFADLIPWPADRVLRLRLSGGGPPLDWELRLAAPPELEMAVPAPAPPAPSTPEPAPDSLQAGQASQTAVVPAVPPGPGVAAGGVVEPGQAPRRVRLDGAPLSAAPGGSYWIIPQAGVEWTADRRQGDWLRLPLAPGLAAWVQEEHAPRIGAAGAPPEPRLLGPLGSLRRLPEGGLELSLPITGETPPLWREECGPGGADWRLVLEQTRSRLDWIELDPAAGLLHLDWEPRPGEELELRAALAPGAFQGQRVRWEEGRLLLTFYQRGAGLKGARVLLDPGHGGGESGCIGASGTREKDLTLTLARELKDELEKAGAEVRLTRDSDLPLSLSARAALAAEWRADYFLSLHFNSVAENQNPWGADGFMAFYWSPWSAEAAALLHERLGRLPLRDRGLHWRSLGVCRQSTCPAILLEAGSLVHPGEEARLLDENFRRRQVKAIRRGMEAWFRQARREKAQRDTDDRGAEMDEAKSKATARQRRAD